MAPLLDVVVHSAYVTSSAEWFVTKPSIIQGAVIGGSIFLLIGEGAFLRRLARGTASALVAYMAAEGVIDLINRWVTLADTPANERLVTMVLGIVGVILAEAILRAAERTRDRTDQLVDEQLGVDDKRDSQSEIGEPNAKSS